MRPCESSTVGRQMADIPQLFGPVVPIEIGNGLRNDIQLKFLQPIRFVRHQQRHLNGTKAQLAAPVACDALMDGLLKGREILRQHRNVIERNMGQKTSLAENESTAKLFQLPA